MDELWFIQKGKGALTAWFQVRAADHDVVFNKEDQVDAKIAQNVCERYNSVSITAIQPQTLMKLILRVQEEILRLYPEGEMYPQLKPMVQSVN